MKKLLLLIIILLCSSWLYSVEPLIRFYNNDGSSKQYNLKDIDSINILDKKNNYVMRIHYKDTLVAYYPTEIIGSIKFEKDSVKRDILNIYIFSYPKSYLLSNIDSVIFYIDKYQPLTIGTQVWMLKNLDVSTYANGDEIPQVTSASQWGSMTKGAWCYFNNDSSSTSIYGKMYNWYAVHDSRGLAPSGWHIPSDAEWTTLTTYLGGDSVAGGKLKETGTDHWLSPNAGGTNESGFSALPGGSRWETGKFANILTSGYWWSSTEHSSTTYAWCRYLFCNSASVTKFANFKEVGFSVRCVRD